jgi:hypothetical protein
MSSNNQENLKYFRDQIPPLPGMLFTDPLFPPNQNSLLGLDPFGKPIDIQAYNDNIKDLQNFQNVSFARPSEIFGNDYQLFSGKIEVDDIKQGILGDCYFLTALGNLCKFPGFILNLFKTKTVNKDGYYEIIMIIDGEPRIVIIDDYLPVHSFNRQPCFAKPNGNELWVMLLEKAWAKVNGGYFNIIGGFANEPLECLTGFGSRFFVMNKLKEKDKNEIIGAMREADQSNCLISCGTIDDPRIRNVGLVERHAYTIIGLNRVETINKTYFNLLRLRNPWSNTEWTGDWSDNSYLWDEKTKSQVNYKKSDDGIFYIRDSDFFRYFETAQICYMLYNSAVVIYQIKGEENLRNGAVFNLVVENEGFLTVSVIRKNWRIHRELRNKALPTHISIVSYNTNPENKFKTFYDYIGTTNSTKTCTLNKKVKKGNYLIYVYRDTDHADFFVEPIMEVKIVCSANFQHAQMNYDLRDEGFPLLQNIIFQSVIEDINYDIYSGRDLNTTGNSLKNNGIGYSLYYFTTPGNYFELNANANILGNMFLISPYVPKFGSPQIKTMFPSGKFIILLALVQNDRLPFCFNVGERVIGTYGKLLQFDYQDNDIDLSYYTDFNNNIKNGTFKRKKTQTIENAKVDINFDINYYDLAELRKIFVDYFKLLDEIPTNNFDINLKWGVIKVKNNSKMQNYVYIGQICNEQKEGKGILVDDFGIFVGQYKNNLKNGIGITYNKDFNKLNEYNYINDNKEDRGTIYYNNNDIYEGETKNGMPEGRGILSTNNYKYEGDFKSGKMEGRGIFFFNNGERYEGDIKNGLEDGKGVLYFDNGNKYEGEFKEGLKDGHGICHYKNGDVYEGEFRQGFITGHGKYFFQDGDYHIGNFKNDKREGKGIFFSKNNNFQYEGDFVNDDFQGKGVLYYPNGDREMGDFYMGKKVGPFAYMHANGLVEPRMYKN